MVIVTAMAVGIQKLSNPVTKIHIELQENVLYFLKEMLSPSNTGL